MSVQSQRGVRRVTIGVTVSLMIAAFVTCIFAAFLLLNAKSVDNAARLSFFGSMAGSLLGIAGAIAGALYVEESKRETTRREDRSLIADALDQLADAIEPVAQDAVEFGQGIDSPDLKLLRGRILEALADINDTIELLNLVIGSAKLDTVEELRTLQTIRRKIDRVRGTIASERNVISNNRPTAGILSVYYEKTQPLSTELLPLLRQVAKELRRSPR